MLNQNLQSEAYYFDTAAKVIADGAQNIKVFYNLSWGILYKSEKTHPYKIKLTPYNDEDDIVIENHMGFWQSPQDVWYKKIELIREPLVSEDLDTDLAGVITYQTVEVSNNEGEAFSGSTLAKRLDYYLKNTKTIFLTVPGGTELSEVLGDKEVYDFYDVQYCLEDGSVKDESKNQITFGYDSIQVSTTNWAIHVPVNYNTKITKGDNVRLDVYLRYWTGEPGERL